MHQHDMRALLLVLGLAACDRAAVEETPVLPAPPASGVVHSAPLPRPALVGVEGVADEVVADEADDDSPPEGTVAEVTVDRDSGPDILDDVDRCPDVPESPDGFEDIDGCPEP
jgi:hypothetical protein